MKKICSYIIVPLFSALLITGCRSTREAAGYDDDVYNAGRPIASTRSENEPVPNDSSGIYDPNDPYYSHYHYYYPYPNYYSYPYLSYGYFPYYYPHYWGWGHHHHNGYYHYGTPYYGNNDGRSHYYGRRELSTGTGRNNNGRGDNYYGHRDLATKRTPSSVAHTRPGSVRGGFGSTGSRASVSSAS